MLKLRRDRCLAPGGADAPILATLALAQLLLFAMVARHGFDLTDEGFYVLNYRHWDATPAFTFFGAYLRPPYHWLSESVWAMRMLGMVSMVLAGILCARELMLSQDLLSRNSASAGLGGAAIAGGMTALDYYGGFIGPYTPSYNTLALVCALLCLALTLSVARSLLTGRPGPKLPAMALGLLLSVGIANKFSTGTIVAVLDALIALALLWNKVPQRAVGVAVLCALAGFAMNFAALAIIDPDLLLRFRQGVAIQLVILPRDLAAEHARFLAVELPSGLFQAARILLWPTVFGTVIAAGGRFLGYRPGSDSVALCGFVVLAMFNGFVRHRDFRIELLWLVAFALWCGGALMHPRPTPPVARTASGREVILGAAILLMPLAYSFGTNNSLLRHMGMAGVFPSLLIVSRLRAMRRDSLLKGWALLAGLCAVAVVPAEIFVRQWSNASYTYRLGTPLRAQTVQLPRNPAHIETLVDASMAEAVAGFLRLAAAAGIHSGSAVLDFTGQGPGLVALTGAKPIAASWIAGGGGFDGASAAKLAVSMVDPAALRSAWLLSSDDSFARVASWREIVASRLGEFPFEQAGRVSIPDPTSSDKNVRMSISIWKPRPSTH